MEAIECDLLTSADAAAELHLTPDRIRQLARAGSLRAMRTRTGQRIFLAEDVAKFKAKRAQIAARAV